jgi:hypothetical protein
MQLAKRALEILNLAFVVDLLSLGEFQRLKHFLHFIQRMFEFLDHAVDLLDCVADGGRLVRRLLVTPVFATCWFAMGFFVVPFLAVLLRVPLFMLLPLLGFFDGRFRGFSGSIAR